MPGKTNELPLGGITVVELAGPPGSWATGLLGDFGARVIKIARVGVPPVRWGALGMRPLVSIEEKMRYAAHNPFDRNKASIALDLRKEPARQVLYQLVGRTDVVIEGYRPGVAQRLGVDYETLTKLNPKLIYCAITGYGQDGPYRNMAGHDINFSALAGLLDLTGNRVGPPAMPGIPVGDWAGGYAQAVIGILLALIARQHTGEGQFIDIAMTDGIVSCMKSRAADYFELGVVPRRGETVSLGGVAYNNIYETKDRRYIAIGCWEPWLYKNLCLALGHEELIPLQYVEGEEGDYVQHTLSQVFLTKTRDEWFDFLKDKDICVAPVNTLPEALANPQILAREMLVEVTHPQIGKVKQIGVGIKLSRTPGRIRHTAPLDGQDSESILAELGYSRHQIDELRKEEAIE